MKVIYNDGHVAECPEEEQLHVIRHTDAQIMAQAIKRLWPHADFAYGPANERGFYYDVDLGDTKLTDEDLQAIEAEMKKQGVFALATATKDGVPNVVPVGMLFVGEDGKVWLIDNFLKKTLKNITENPQVSFYVWNPEAKESYQVKGRAAVISSGYLNLPTVLKSSS